MNGLNIFQRLYIALGKSKAKNNLFRKALFTAKQPNLFPQTDKNAVHFRHSGLIGDIIYAIPAMNVLAGGKEIHLHLLINQKSLYKKSMRHYNQNKILTEKSVEWLAPLLLSQPDFTTCDIYVNQRIDYDLDEFRRFPFDYNMGHICRWYFLTYGITTDLSKPWLFVKPDISFGNEIVISRSFRYRAPGISYDFLAAYPRLTFLGLPEEFADMQKVLPHLKYHRVNDFLEMAQIIAGCKFFIGNQSFPYSLAEALKVKRGLEVCFECPNVIPEGEFGYDFCYQPQFEKIVKQLDNPLIQTRLS
jgi:hypothetical protein